MKSSFIGSTVVMVIGAISFVGQLQHWPNVNQDNTVGGVTAILGAIAYRSAKQRRFGLKHDAGWRRSAEIVLLLLTFIPLPFAATTPDGIIHQPVTSVVIPVWSLIAYMFVRYKRVEPPIPSIK